MAYEQKTRRTTDRKENGGATSEAGANMADTSLPKRPMPLFGIECHR